MKIQRGLLAAFVSLFGVLSFLMGIAGIWFMTTPQIGQAPMKVWVITVIFVIGFILAGCYLVRFAIRVFSSKDPLLSASTPKQEKTTYRFSTVMNIVLGLFFASKGEGGDFLTRFLIAEAVLFLTSHLLIGLHECGHLFAALAVGARPVVIRIGVGSELISCMLGSLHLTIGIRSSAGYVKAIGRDGKWTRGHLLIFVMGGPLMSLAAFLIVFWYCYQSGNAFDFLQLSPWKSTCLYFLLLQSFVVLLGSLKTADACIEGQLFKSDMAVILKCLFAPAAELESLSGDQTSFEELWTLGRKKEAWRLLLPQLPQLVLSSDFAPVFVTVATELSLEEAPLMAKLASETLERTDLADEHRALLLLVHGIALAHLSQPEQARALFSEAIQTAKTDELKVHLYELMANLVIVAQLMDYLPEADVYSQAAIALQPDVITLKGTRGSILVELCRVEEGVAMLEEVFENSPSNFDKTISAYFLALGHHRARRVEQAQPWLDEMMLHEPPSWLLDRARNQGFLVPCMNNPAALASSSL